MSGSVYVYIFVMAAVTYLIRMAPLTLIRKEITNTFIKSFLYYVPYVTLSVMIFPAVLSSTESFWSGLIGFLIAVVSAFFNLSMVQVSLFACIGVFLTELFI